LVVNSDNTVTVLEDPLVPPYDGSEDTLVGIVNNSPAPVPAVTVFGPGTNLGGLDSDGLCSFGVTGCPFGPTGYEGPGTSIKASTGVPDIAEIDFSGQGLAPGATAYFSLEGALTSAKITSRPGPMPTGLTLSTSVTDEPISPDPGTHAYVHFILTAINADGSPASNAAVTLSNAKPGDVFHTNASGVLNLLERVTAGDSLTITANVTATNGSTASAQQEVYSSSTYAVCSFKGQPQTDISLLTEMLGGLWGAVADLIHSLIPFIGGYTTTTYGYKITVPGASDIYAQWLTIANAKQTKVNETDYSRKQLLKPDLNSQLARSCGGGPA